MRPLRLLLLLLLLLLPVAWECAAAGAAAAQQAEQLYQQALALFNENQVASAAPLAQRAATLVDSVPYSYFAGHTSQQLGDVESARRFFERALDVARRANAAIPLDQTYWLNLQYAELLREHVIPYATPAEEQSARLKAQAIQHYESALAAETALANASLTSFDPHHDRALSGMQRNRLHALNTVGVLLNELRRFRDAVPFFERAIAFDPTAVQPLGNLALALSSLGQQEDALRVNQRALEVNPEQPLVLHNVGLLLQSLDRSDEALEYWRRAHAVNPNETETISAIAGYYADIGDGKNCLLYLRLAQDVAEAVLEKDPMRASAVAEVMSNRVRIANAKLPLVYQSVDEILNSRMRYTEDLQMLLNEQIGYLEDPLVTTNIGSMGYYAVYQGFNDADIRSQLAQIYRRGIHALSFTAPHVLHDRHKVHHYPLATPAVDGGDDVVVHSSRRIRVGFHSGFMRHHSVGLLTQGVITQLDRSKFEVIVIIYEETRQDDLTRKVLESADTVVLLQLSLLDAQQRVAALQLDVLVFTEIGMDPKAYFLAFSRLALRSAVFWGHAVTSGIDTVDYFISSSLFHVEKLSSGSGHYSGDQQSKYIECVYEMNGLTTYFLSPTPPLVGNSLDWHDHFRESLGLPPRRVLETMLLVPQTLYKLHPDFDVLVERILLEAPRSSFLVALTGSKPRLADQIRARWRRTLSSGVYKRVYFVRMLDTREFMDLCAVADVVLDPFPVGGGRSSLEIFSVGTPIVLLASRTTILQLTAAMYKLMGFDDLIAFTEEEYVSIATKLVLDPTLRAHYRQRILANKAKLYERRDVINEWEQFFVAILAAKPPAERAEEDHVAYRTRDQCPHFPKGNTSDKVEPDRLPKEPLFEIRITLAGHTDGDGPDQNEFVLQLQTAEDNPFETITQFVARYPSEFDWLHQNFTAKLLWNARQRLQQPIVGRFDIDAFVVDPIEVRFGDDLHLMARAHLMREFKRRGEVLSQLHLPLLNRLISDLKQRIPEHASPEWIAARSFQLKNRVERSESETSSFTVLGDTKNTNSNCVTLLMTTCKRLPLFLRTIASLERALDISSEVNVGGVSSWSTWFCAILVIDDNSSEEDRRAMTARVPSETFEFIFKSPEQRGHARSLNLGLKHVRSRYLMYLEDDWEFRDLQLRPARFLMDSLAILQKHSTSVHEPLGLVLFNDQHGGWKRTLTVSELPKNGVSPQTSREIPYRVHEYASSDPTHEFAYWPGFSLNPGLWDLHAITRALCSDELTPATSFTEPNNNSGSCLHQQLFDEDLDIFEHTFSLRVWRSGLRVAFLTEKPAVHIGAPTGSNSSAYVLNGMRRRFDAPASVV